MIFLFAAAVAVMAGARFLESGLDVIDAQKQAAFGEVLEKTAPGAWLVVYEGRVHAVVQDATYAALALSGLRDGCPLTEEERGALPPGVPENAAITHYKGVGRYVAG